jgi:predicted RNase H-like nuclease
LSFSDVPGDAPVAIGVDGCRSGWIAALFLEESGGHPTSLKHFATVGELATWRERLGGETLVTIDVPIGLPESTRFRRCDEVARHRLGERRSSVFMPPGRYLLAAQDHSEARRLVEERKREAPLKKGIGAQAWGIVPKIREVDELLQAKAEYQEWLQEVHPEVCFLAWSGVVLRSKQSAAGQVERFKLVREEFPDVERAILEDLNPTEKVDLTDVLDAYAALWTALRWAAGEHETLVEEVLDGLRANMIV